LNLIALSLVLATSSVIADEHSLEILGNSGKKATEATVKANKAFAKTLNFEL